MTINNSDELTIFTGPNELILEIESVAQFKIKTKTNFKNPFFEFRDVVTHQQRQMPTQSQSAE